MNIMLTNMTIDSKYEHMQIKFNLILKKNVRLLTLRKRIKSTQKPEKKMF